MDIIVGIILFMGGAILALLNINKNLRSKNKIKDLEIEDVKLQVEQKNLKKEKENLKNSLKNIKVDSDLNDKEIEDFWNKKGK